MLYQRELNIDGIKRTYQINIPQRISAESNFAVLALHGAGGSSDISIYENSLDERSEQEGFIAVFPDALPANHEKPADFKTNPRIWIAKPTDGNEPRDLTFIRALIINLKKEFGLQNVFVAGFSNGAIMTSYLAIKIPELITAIAPVCGKLLPPEPNVKRIIPTKLIIGGSDPLFPLDGAVVKLHWGNDFYAPPVKEYTEPWIAMVSKPREITHEENENMETVTYSNRETEFSIVTVRNHGHIWPGGKSKLTYRIVGEPNRNIFANNIILDFFRKWKK